MLPSGSQYVPGAHGILRLQVQNTRGRRSLSGGYRSLSDTRMSCLQRVVLFDVNPAETSWMRAQRHKDQSKRWSCADSALTRTLR